MTTGPHIEFLNVDLDIESSEPLDPLLLGMDAFVLHHEPRGSGWFACLELHGCTLPTAEETMAGFCTLLERLSGDAAAVWGRCTKRTLNVGVSFRATVPYATAVVPVVSPQTAARVAAAGASIEMTIYAHGGTRRRAGGKPIAPRTARTQVVDEQQR